MVEGIQTENQKMRSEFSFLKGGLDNTMQVPSAQHYDVGSTIA
jgi:hypothetical protein